MQKYLKLEMIKCIHEEAPEYLISLIDFKSDVRPGLRSNSDNKLMVPFTRKKTFADRAFSVYGPTRWNMLPKQIRDLPNTKQFKKELKTFLFQKHFN